MLRIDDMPQRVADDIHAFGVIGIRGIREFTTVAERPPLRFLRVATDSFPQHKRPLRAFVFIQAAGLVYHRRAKCGAYHQPLRGCISSRSSVHLPAA